MTSAATGRSRSLPVVACLRLGLAVLAGVLVPSQRCVAVAVAAKRSNPVHVTLHAKKAHHPKRPAPTRHGPAQGPSALPAATRGKASGGNPTPVATPTTAVTSAASSTPTVPATATTAPVGVNPSPVLAPATSPSTSSLEQQIVALTNQARLANGLPSLDLDGSLCQAASIQATGMAALDLMDHELPGMPQPTFASRLQYVGYSYGWAGENLAAAAIDAPTVVTLWMSSPEHRANILSPYAVSTGVAVVCDSQGMPYFCQVFAAP
jgi:uncharacterized protein YkwD